MRVGVRGDRLGAGQTKVRQLELAHGGDEQVLGFDVAVQDPPGVTEREASQQLEHEQLDVASRQPTRVLLKILTTREKSVKIQKYLEKSFKVFVLK